MTTKIDDQHGNAMTATPESAALYDETLDRLLRFDVAVVDLAGRLEEEAADAPMASAMLAYLSLTSTDAADVAAAQQCLAAMEAMEKNERESMHTAAIAAWCQGDWAGASELLDDLLQQYPTDLLALMVGHQLDFFLGDNLNLRDRVCRSLLEAEPWYAFNDLHAMMALVGAGRLDDARAHLARLDAYLETADGTNASMTAEIGLPASRAILAHAEGRSADLVAELAPIRRRLHHFGGSHAQRDALQRTLLDASIRAGDHPRAQALLNERLTLRPTSVYGWTQQARLHTDADDARLAASATATAAEHRDRFAAAATGVSL